jgi:hypothetical protein
MDTRRQELLNRLEAAAATSEDLLELCSTIGFQIMYGLPWEIQINAACHMCEHYLPIFEAKWPDVAWPRQLLADVDAWHRAEGRGRPHCPDEADSADGAYYFCFDFLLSAYHHKDDPVSLTSGSFGAMSHAAYARAYNVWLADDVEGALVEKKLMAYYAIDEACRPSEPPVSERLRWDPKHNIYNNVAFMAVYRREFQRIAEWLRAEAVWKYPEPDLDAMMRGLARWKDHDFLPMGPERAEGEFPSE